MDEQNNVKQDPPQGAPGTAIASPPPAGGQSPGREATFNLEEAVPPEDFGKLTKHRLPWGVAGVFVWLLLFSIGVLIPAEPSRINLGWKPQSDVETKSKKLEERITEIENKDKIPKADKQDAPKAPDPAKTDKPNDAKPSPTPGAPDAPVLPVGAGQGKPSSGTDTMKSDPKPDKSIKLEKQDTAEAGSPDPHKTSKFWSFVVATFTFTPLNVGFLCVLASFIGGCSINRNEIHRIHQEILDLEANPPVPPNPDLARLRQRLDYLTEHPGYSTIRGLVVYLIIISGLFIIGAPLTGENGSQSITLAQYMKLAGLFSFFGYLAGYDPTVFSSVIGLGTRQLNSGKPPQ